MDNTAYQVWPKTTQQIVKNRIPCRQPKEPASSFVDNSFLVFVIKENDKRI